MADPQINITGKSMLVRRRAAANQQPPFELLAAAKTKAIQFVNELGETTSHDPNAPNDAPWRTSLLVSRSWTLNISGSTDMKRHAALQADAMTAIAPGRYALEFQGTKANGGGTLAGDVWVENYQVQSSNMGIVEFTAQLRGEGAPVWTEAGA